MIIGFGHRKRSGKDTCGQFLVDEYGYRRVAFAGPLKRAAMQIFGFTEQQCYGSEADKETVDPRWGFTPRYALQTLGEKMRVIFGDDVWVKSAEAAIMAYRPPLPVMVTTSSVPEKDVENLRELLYHAEPVIMPKDSVTTKSLSVDVVITDVRYPNEAEMIRRNGGIVVRVDRPSLGPLTDAHPSETSMEGFTYDYVLVNDGTIVDLQNKLVSLMQDLEKR